MKQKGRTAFIVSFLAPAVAIYGLFVLYPLVQAFSFALYRWRGVSAHRTFVGTKNFADLAKDEAFRTAAFHNIELLIFGGAAIIAIAIAVAHALKSEKPAIQVLRGVVLFPQMVSLVAVATLWTFLFNPQFGPLKGLLPLFHVDSWLGNSRTALPAVGTTFVWYALGFTIMLFSAGLKALPEEVMEASELDGATGFRRFREVTWPMMWSVKRVAIVNISIAVMNVFALVYLMTQGGPDRASEVMLTYLYENGFVDFQVGYATAIAVANFVIVMVLSVAILFFTRRNPEVSR
jgi:ABC-type sugar transport system permease subunit